MVADALLTCMLNDDSHWSQVQWLLYHTMEPCHLAVCHYVMMAMKDFLISASQHNINTSPVASWISMLSFISLDYWTDKMWQGCRWSPTLKLFARAIWLYCHIWHGMVEIYRSWLEKQGSSACAQNTTRREGTVKSTKNVLKVKSKGKDPSKEMFSCCCLTNLWNPAKFELICRQCSSGVPQGPREFSTPPQGGGVKSRHSTTMPSINWLATLLACYLLTSLLTSVITMQPQYCNSK